MRAFTSLTLITSLNPVTAIESVQAPGAGDAISGASDRVGSLITLIEKLKSDFISEFNEAKTAYDKQSCAHEDTIKTSEKARDAAIVSIKELATAIDKNSADIGSLSATIEANERDIKAKEQEIKDAIEHRKSEHEEYGQTVKEFNDAIKSAQLAYEVLTNADDASLKKTRSFLSTPNDQKKLWSNIKTGLTRLPLNGKIMTVDKLEQLNEFVDTTLSRIDNGESLLENDNGSKTSSNAFVQFGPASQAILGILKDMRGQYVSKLQGAQLSEQEAASAHVSFVERARNLVSAMKDSKQAREAELDATKAEKESNISERDAKEKEKVEMDTLMRETKTALVELGREWGKTTTSHNNEQNGIAKALNYLGQQQSVQIGGSGPAITLVNQESGANNQNNNQKSSLLQKIKKPLYNNMFQKIAWAIEDMVKTHQETLADNKSQRESCNNMQAQANGVAARKKAAIEALDRKISELQSKADSTKIAKGKMEQEIKDTNQEIKDSHEAWEKSDASRVKEIDELTESARLITGAVDALGGSGSDRMGDVIGILEMLKNECVSSINQLGKAKLSESNTWTEQKTAMANMVLSLEADVKKAEAEITNLNKKRVDAESKKTKVAGQVPMNLDECKSFLGEFQGKQDALNQKIQDLTSAKSHLLGWKNMSSDAEHFDGAATAYVPK